MLHLLSPYARQRVRVLMEQGAGVKETMQCLFPIHQTFWWLKRHYNQHDSNEPLQSSGQPTNWTDEVLELIDTAQLGDSMSNCSSCIYAICHFALS